jgi:glycine cleavage system H protein
MDSVASFSVDGYVLAADRWYDPETNLWVQLQQAGRATIGFDPLGAETTGDVVAISFAETGTWVPRNGVLATVEAAKFVGPVRTPLSGRVMAVNEALIGDPGLINLDPLSAWLVEVGEIVPGELELLLSGRDSVAPWFAEAVKSFRRTGAIAQ